MHWPFPLHHPFRITLRSDVVQITRDYLELGTGREFGRNNNPSFRFAAISTGEVALAGKLNFSKYLNDIVIEQLCSCEHCAGLNPKSLLTFYFLFKYGNLQTGTQLFPSQSKLPGSIRNTQFQNQHFFVFYIFCNIIVVRALGLFPEYKWVLLRLFIIYHDGWDN